MRLKTIKQIKNLKGKKVLLRVDVNCPVKNRKITDDARIQAALPTIEYLVKQKAKVILISHLGRSKGKKNKKYTLRPVYNNLKSQSANWRKNLKFINDCLGLRVKKAIDKLKPGQVILLENLRFYSGETKNDLGFAKQLANLADLYVNDAFAVCHRTHASVVGITKYLPPYAGFLLEKEVKSLSRVCQKPVHPLVVLMGGVKISTKISLIKNLARIADQFLIGGALAHNFFQAAGYKTGDSIYEPKMIKASKKLLKNKKIILPVDVKIKSGVKTEARPPEVGPPEIYQVNELAKKINQDFKILDIGLKTVKLFSQYIKNAKMIVWNGPMGYLEDKKFAEGTKKIAQAILANKKAKVIIGGGETIASLQVPTSKFQIPNNVFISTGGGAMLEFLSSGLLPGIRPLVR